MHFVTLIDLTWALQINKLLLFCILYITVMFFVLNTVFVTYIVLFSLTRLLTWITNKCWSFKYVSVNILRHEINFVS